MIGELDLSLVPELPVLFLEEQEPARAILSSRDARRMQMHQGGEGKGLGRLTHGMLCEDLCQSDGLVAELSTNRHLRMRREIALGEQQVEDRVHGGEARRELLRREVVG